MSVVTIEATVEDGQIRLPDNLILPEQTKVYIVIPNLTIDKVSHIYSPRLKNREQATDFVMEVTKVTDDA